MSTTPMAPTATKTAIDYQPSFLPNESNGWVIYLYCIVLMMWLLSLFRSFLMIQIFLKSTYNLHAIILKKLLHGNY